MRSKLVAITSVAMAMCLLAGCGMTQEEKAAKAAADAAAAELQEEQATGIKRLTSENLDDSEKSLYNFVMALREDDAQTVADTIGAPNIFPESYLYSWTLTNGYEPLKETDLSNIRVASAKSGNTAELSVYVDSDKPTDTYISTYEGGRWVLTPPSGVASDFEFTAPTKRVECNGISFADYIVSANDNSYSWNYSVPHMMLLEDSPVYIITSNLGSFNGAMYTVDGKNVILADMSTKQKETFEAAAVDVFTSIFDMLKADASADELSRILLSEKTITDCYTFKNEEARATYKEKLATVTNVTIAEDDVQTGWPATYTYRLSGEDAVTMNVKLCIGTTLGDSRKKATIVMQNFDGVWKLVSVVTKSGENPFVEFNTYNPAW